ncbi:MAG TPA: iron-sulfur cluster assembly scaffold protein [Caulobacteraceae bacterium]|jgi:NifU-like protein involved in Fe-S cluster formation|nr:iron-sulfur cluster assembly scaffold protein [Caulobacteraceae bacterium]
MIDALYSLKILKLAAHLPRTGRLAAPDGSAERVAKLCGSRARVDVKLEGDKVVDYAQEVEACALGQATAAIVGEQVIGAEVAEIEAARDQMRAMLKLGGPVPSGRFAGLSDLEVVRDYPARHASALVALEAAAEAARQALDRQALDRTTRTSRADAA